MIGKVKSRLQQMYDNGENVEVVKGLLDTMIQPSMKIIDIGPGTGSLIHHLHKIANERGIQLELHVLDYLHSILDGFPNGVRKHLFNLHSLANTQTEIQEIPIADRTFDMVLFTEVIEHVTFPQVMISEIARILKPKGLLVITTPNIFCLGNRLATFIGTDKLFRKVGEEGFVSTIEFNSFGHVGHYSPKSLMQLLLPWFTIQKRTGSCFKIPGVRFFQTTLAKTMPNLANHIIIIGQRRDMSETRLKIVPCMLTGAKELTLPDGRCLHPVPHNRVCYDCPYFHKDFLHRNDRRKKPGYIPR